jgi:hypothetical protein
MMSKIHSRGPTFLKIFVESYTISKLFRLFKNAGAQNACARAFLFKKLRIFIFLKYLKKLVLKF